MLIGVPKEIKAQEYRVGLLPSSVNHLTSLGHQVFFESQLGAGIGYSDDDYLAAGGKLKFSAEDLYRSSDLIVKVKEPQPKEYDYFRPEQLLFSYLHLAAEPDLVENLIKSKVTAIAYETVYGDNERDFPLLTPMSEIAGRIAIQAGADSLQKFKGGKGKLLSGVPGVPPARVLILGAGTVGCQAVRMAVGMESEVVVMDISLPRLRELDAYYGNRVQTLHATSQSIADEVAKADLVIGAVLIPGAKAPKLVTRDMVANMKPGSVIVDVAIDQGGCFETSRPTTHQNPTYEVDGVLHYCVANMPGAVAWTASHALINATLPYITLLANNGLDKAFKHNKGLKAGLNIHQGHMTHSDVAAALGRDFIEYT